MTIVLGLDPSLTHTAAHWAAGNPVAQALNVTHRGKFAIKSRPQENRFARLHVLSGMLVDRIGALPSPALGAVAFVEGYSFGSKNAREQLGEWGGILRLTLLQLGWDVVEVAPPSLKKFVTGKGNAEKDGVRMEVLKRWEYSSTDNNDADAYALMRLGVEWLRWSTSPDFVTKANAKLCEKLVVLRASDLATSGGR